MPAQKRHKTKYPGVYYIEGQAIGSSKTERIYYIMYRKDGKQIHEKAGRQFADDMSPARAASLRGRRIEGNELPNKQKRSLEESLKRAESGKWTISRLFAEYLKNRPDVKDRVNEKSRFKNYIEPSFGGKEPSELLPLDVDRLRLSLLKKKSPGTVKNVLELLRRIINFGIKKRLCTGVNFSIEMPKVNNQKTEDLTPEQLQGLLKAIDEDGHPQAGNIMRLVLFTGLRRSEIFKLKWNHVDFEKGFIEIKNPKSGIDQRIPLNEAARDLLLSQPKASEFVFPGRNGGQRTDIKNQVNRIRDAAGLPKNFRSLHGLRHVYASMLASSGQVDLYTLQRLLTHKSPVMTQRYAHLRDETLKKASNIAGDIISKAVSEKAENDVNKVVDLKSK